MFIDRVGRAWRRWQLEWRGAHIANDLQSSSSFFSGDASGFSCGSQAWLAAGARVIIGGTESGSGRLTIGSGLFMNHYAIINCHHEIVIGDNVMIGPHAYICDFDHDIPTDGIALRSRYRAKPVHIGHGVWIGANVVVLKGVKIGDGAVVGAGSVVTSDVSPQCIFAGNPAVLLRRS